MKSIQLDANSPEAIDHDMHWLIEHGLDITGPAFVDVTLSTKGTVLWVNINGICVLRVCQLRPGDVMITDEGAGEVQS